jgi:hypothetical protein
MFCRSLFVILVISCCARQSPLLSCFEIIFQKYIHVDAHLGLSHSTTADQMLPIDINGVNKATNRKVLSQNKCIMHDLLGCNKESLVTSE